MIFLVLAKAFDIYVEGIHHSQEVRGPAPESFRCPVSALRLRILDAFDECHDLEDFVLAVLV